MAILTTPISSVRSDVDRYITEGNENLQYRRLDFSEISDTELEQLYQTTLGKNFSFKLGQNDNARNPEFLNFKNKVVNKQHLDITAERKRRIDEGNYTGDVLEDLYEEPEYQDSVYQTLTIKDNG